MDVTQLLVGEPGPSTRDPKAPFTSAAAPECRAQS